MAYLSAKIDVTKSAQDRLRERLRALKDPISTQTQFQSLIARSSQTTPTMSPLGQKSEQKSQQKGHTAENMPPVTQTPPLDLYPETLEGGQQKPLR